MIRSQLIRYASVGVLAAAAQFLVTYLGHSISPLTGLSAALGYAAGLCVSFIGQRHFTFKSKNMLHQDLSNFAKLAIAILFLNYVLMWALIEAGAPPLLASAACVIATTLASFTAMKLWVFKNSEG